MARPTDGTLDQKAVAQVNPVEVANRRYNAHRVARDIR